MLLPRASETVLQQREFLSCCLLMRSPQCVSALFGPAGGERAKAMRADDLCLPAPAGMPGTSAIFEGCARAVASGSHTRR